MPGRSRERLPVAVGRAISSLLKFSARNTKWLLGKSVVPWRGIGVFELDLLDCLWAVSMRLMACDSRGFHDCPCLSTVLVFMDQSQ